jgi:hypothetical protein
MPTLGLTKVAFGCRDFDALAARVALRVDGGELRIATRYKPKRADEVIGGGLHWIVKHRLVGCNEILRFDEREDGRIDIVCSPQLVRVTPAHCRAHQGWRYYESGGEEVTEDLSGVGLLPPQLYGRLAALALV